MVIRHCTEASNVDARGHVVSPTQICHVVIEHGRIADKSGLIDPTTHLNLDYPDHKVDRCAIAVSLEVGASVRFNEGGPEFALVPYSAYQHLGPVDYTTRLQQMVALVTGEGPGDKEEAT